MNRLILDHFRRWWLLLASFGGCQLLLGWYAVKFPNDLFGCFITGTTFATGSCFLGNHLKLGLARVIATLPLTAIEAGRGYWLATIGIPAAALIALLFLGAGIFQYFHPSNVFPFERLAASSLFILALLGTMFTTLYHINGSNWRTWMISSVQNWTANLMFLSSFFFYKFGVERPKIYFAFITIGLLLTITSWVRTRELLLGPVTYRPTVKRAKTLSAQRGTTSRFGGIPFLMVSIIGRVLLMCLGFSGVIWLLIEFRIFRGQPLSQDGFGFNLFSGMGCLCVSMMTWNQLQPVRQHIRALRTMPVSTVGLAMTVMAMAVLPLLVMGTFFAGLAWMFMGASAIITILRNVAFFLAPASLNVFVLFCCGQRPLGKVVTVIILTVSFTISLVESKILRDMTSGLAILVLIAGVLLTVRLFKRSSSIYRDIPVRE